MLREPCQGFARRACCPCVVVVLDWANGCIRVLFVNKGEHTQSGQNYVVTVAANEVHERLANLHQKLLFGQFEYLFMVGKEDGDKRRKRKQRLQMMNGPIEDRGYKHAYIRHVLPSCVPRNLGVHARCVRDRTVNLNMGEWQECTLIGNKQANTVLLFMQSAFLVQNVCVCVCLCSGERCLPGRPC